MIERDRNGLGKKQGGVTHRQLRAGRALSLFNNVPLRTPQKGAVTIDFAHNGASLNYDNVVLALN